MGLELLAQPTSCSHLFPIPESALGSWRMPQGYSPLLGSPLVGPIITQCDLDPRPACKLFWP